MIVRQGLTICIINSKQDLDRLMNMFSSGATPPAECGTGCRSRFAALEHMNNARDRLAGYLFHFDDFCLVPTLVLLLF